MRQPDVSAIVLGVLVVGLAAYEAKAGSPQTPTVYQTGSNWITAVSEFETFTFSAANVVLADEVAAPPAIHSGLGTSALTFHADDTGLAGDFRMVAPTVYEWWFDDDAFSGADHLTPGNVDASPDDDFAIQFFGPRSVYACAFDLIDNGAGGDFLTVSFGGHQETYGVSGWSFIGIVSPEPISSVYFDNGIPGDDVAIANFRIAQVVLPPYPPALTLEMPAKDTELQQGQLITITWDDDAQFGAQISLYFDPDLGDSPWDEGKVSNEIPIPISVDASLSGNELTWYTSDLDPGTYSIWGKSDNGVDDPAYSRAPGLVTVTLYTEGTEPFATEGPIDFDSIPHITYVLPRNDGASNLYLVTHGWNGPFGEPDHSWTMQMASNVAAHLTGSNQPMSNDWDVAVFDWQSEAGGLIQGPGATATRALELGELLAEEISARGYTHVEVVAHSAGSWLAHKIATDLPSDRIVQLTLLDAYVPPNLDAAILGASANHVANYYGATPTIPFCIFVPGVAPICTIVPTPFTQENLESAFNVDVSCRFLDYLGVCQTGLLACDHFTPVNWYLASTVALSPGMEFDEFCPEMEEMCFPLGFKMSKAYQGRDSAWSESMASYPINDDPYVLDCTEDPEGIDCTTNTSIFVVHPDSFDFTTMQSVVGEDGSVVIEPDNVELTTGVESAWVGFDVPIEHALSAVLFDVEFTSADLDAEGYATGYWVGAQLSANDERFADGGIPATSSFLFFETLQPGERVISFRLDANGGPTSSVRVSNLRIGMFIDGDINGDCELTEDDLCAWVEAPFDLNGDGEVDDQDQTLLATGLGVSEADENENGIPDGCETSADLDGDGDVDFNDLLILLASWGLCEGLPCPADIDSSGEVSFADLLILLADWS